MKQIRLALVNLNKPHDLAVVAQVALALQRIEVFLVGNTLDLTHPKVLSKVRSWNIDPAHLRKVRTTRASKLSELDNYRLIGLMPTGGNSLFEAATYDNNLYVLGGANGLSSSDERLLDTKITLKCDPCVPFLTVASVVPALCFYLDHKLSGGIS